MSRLSCLGLLCLLVALSGCDDDVEAQNDALDDDAGDDDDASDDDDTTAGDDDSGEAGDCSEYDESMDFVTLDDAANFSWHGTLEVEVYEVAELTDVRIDWSQLAHDTMAQPLDPATDIDTASLIAFPHLGHDEAVTNLNDNTLSQADVGLFVYAEVSGTSHSFLADMTLFGSDVDVETYFSDDYAATWLVTLDSGGTPGAGIRSCAILDPSPTSEVATAYIDDDSCVVHPDADFGSLVPATAAECAPLTFQWSGLTTDGFGNTFPTTYIDGLSLSFHAGQSPADLEDTYLFGGVGATEVWKQILEEGSTSTLLDGHPSAAGTPFDGISGGGTWLLALTCSTCSSPAPPFVTVLTLDE